MSITLFNVNVVLILATLISYKKKSYYTENPMRFLITFAILFLSGTAIVFFALQHKGFVIQKYNDIRLLLLDGKGPNCLMELRTIGAVFKPLGDYGTKGCPVLNAVKLSEINNINLSSPVILSCPAAVQFSLWAKEIKAKDISHIGSLNCRNMRGSRVKSEHSFGLAIDITAIDGAVVSKHWKDNGRLGKKLHNAALLACKHFSNVLTPNTNKLHHSHFHFDLGIGYNCDAKSKINF